MKTFFRYLILIYYFLLFCSCSSVKIQDYKNEKPNLVLEEYLNGTLDAYGVFQDRSGKVIKRFHCIIEASWKGENGVLDEKFYYSDGTQSQRIWKLTKTSDSKYIGTADDIKGAASGELAGNALFWKYVMILDVDGKKYEVNFDDWMYLMNDKVMLNKSVMSKFGVYLGEVILTFVKR